MPSWKPIDDRHLRVSYLDRCRLLSVVASVWFMAVAGSAFVACGQALVLKGDRELLRTAAAEYRANLDRLQTWRGHISFALESASGGKTRVVECTIGFAWDKKAGVHSWDIRTTRDVWIENGKEVPAIPLERMAGVFRDGAYHELRYPLDKESSAHAVVVKATPPAKPGLHYQYFEPSYVFGYGGRAMDKEWRRLYQDANNKLEGMKESPVMVARDGNRVVIERTTKPDGRSKEEIDLAQGGNIERFSKVFTLGQAKYSLTTAWKWQNIKGVWVPEELRDDDVHAGQNPGTNRVTFKWTESVVNEPFPKDAFSLANLGTFCGDGIIDMRTQKTHRIEDKEYPARPAEAPPVTPRPTYFRTTFVVLNLVLALLIVAALCVRQFRKRRRQ